MDVRRSGRARIGFLCLLAFVGVVRAGADQVQPTGVTGAPATGTLAPAAEPESSSVLRTFDTDEWSDRPMGQWPWSVLETVEGSTVTDRIGNGGLYTGEPSLSGIHGSSWTQISYRLGGLDITDPDGTGTPMFLPDAIAFRSLSVATALMPADVAGPGAALQFVPREVRGAWHGVVGGDVVPTGLQSSTPPGPPAIARYASFGRGRFRVEGPLTADRLRLLVSASVTRAERLERDDPTRLPARAASILTNLSWRASPSDEIGLLVAAQGVTHAYSGRARLGTADARESDRFVAVEPHWDRRGAVPLLLSAGYVRGTFDPALPEGAPPIAVERLRDGPVPQLVSGASRRQRTSFAARVVPLEKAGLGGVHRLRFGLEGSWSLSATRSPGAAPLTPETVGGVAARVWDYGWLSGQAVWRGSDLSAHVADSARYGRASVDLGLRVQSMSASADGTPTRVRWSDVSPRLAGRLRLTQGDAWSLLVGYARYYDRLPLHLASYGDPHAPQGLVYRWLDANGDGRFQPDERGPLVAPVGPGGSVASIDPALRAPSTDEFAAGLEFRSGGAWSAHVLGLRRRQHHLLAVVNEGAPRSAYTVSSVPDPGGNTVGSEDDQLLPIYDRIPATFGQDRYRLVNTTAGVLYEGVEIGASGSVAARLKLHLGAMGFRAIGPAGDVGFRASENDQGILDAGIGSPNAATFASGRLFFDRSYVLKLSAAYRAPGGLSISAAARYQDGQPFARIVVAPDLHQGAEAIRAIPNGRSRFTYTLTVDARVEKGFSVGPGRVAAVLEVFNALGDAREVEENVITGAAFRDVSAVQPPRAFRLGARFEF